jgi:hypothetical protein
MMIRPGVYPQVERRAGDQGAARRGASGRPDGTRPPNCQSHFRVTSAKLTFTSGKLPSIRLFGDANYFSAA